MAGERILIIEDDPESVEILLTEILTPHGYSAQIATTGRAALSAAQEHRPDLVLLGLGGSKTAYTEMLGQLQLSGDPPVIVLGTSGAEAEALRAVRLGARDAFMRPFKAEEVATVIARVLHQERVAMERDWLTRKLAGSNTSLEQSLAETQTLCDIGKTLASSLNLQDVLIAVVRAAVSLTQADEGYLLLRGLESDELYLCAFQSLDENCPTGLRVRVEDSIAHRVMRFGTAVALSSNGGTHIGIKRRRPVHITDNPVRSLACVPLCIQQRVIGVLGVDNVVADRSFAQSDVISLTALADSAAIAISNAQAYTHTDQTLSRVLADASTAQYKIDLLLNNISEGVFTVDSDMFITSVNPAVVRVTGWQENELLGRRVDDIFVPQVQGTSISFSQTILGEALHSKSSTGPQECTILHKDSHRIPVLCMAAPLKDAQGSVTSVLATIRSTGSEAERSDDRRQVVEMLRSHSSQLDRLTDEAFHSLHENMGTALPHCHPVTLRPIINQVVSSYKKITSHTPFRVTFAPDLPFAVGNESKIELVLVNLVENALLLGGPQQPIMISAYANDNHVVVSVEGTGVTGPTEAHDQLLRPMTFLDGHQSIDESQMSWWVAPQIRLYVAKKLIQAQGGKVWTENRSKSSACFNFSLPKIEVQDVIPAIND